VVAKQVLYHLSHPPSPYFSCRVSKFLSVGGEQPQMAILLSVTCFGTGITGLPTCLAY
jgi:hypothetical protein